MTTYSVKCPKCGAGPGLPCIGSRAVRQQRKSPHIQRVSLARPALKASVRPPNNRWAILRAKVFARLGSGCFYCGSDASHVDHKTPLSRGGSNHLSNLVPSCVACNIAKGTKTAEEFAR